MENNKGIKINNEFDIIKYSEYLTVDELSDISSRIRDWLSSGGKDGDPYIHQQFRYAERLINLRMGEQENG